MSASRSDAAQRDAALDRRPSPSSHRSRRQRGRSYGVPRVATVPGNPRAMAGGVAMLLLILMALLAPVLAPYNPDTARVELRLNEPATRQLDGHGSARGETFESSAVRVAVSLSIAVLAMLVSSMLGVSVGLAAGTTAAGSTRC